MPASPASPTGGPRSPIGDADREHLVRLLREHYAHGRLDNDELSRRVGIVLAAEFADEAASAIADLPPLVPGPPAPGQRAMRRGHAQAARPGPGWVPTAERFRDPTTQVVMRVWTDPADHSRHYIPESDQ
jgi:hypothetical protein